MKEWDTRPMPRSTVLQVVHEYCLVPVASWTHEVLLANFPWGCNKTGCCAPFSSRNSMGCPSTLRVTLGPGGVPNTNSLSSRSSISKILAGALGFFTRAVFHPVALFLTISTLVFVQSRAPPMGTRAILLTCP